MERVAVEGSGVGTVRASHVGHTFSVESETPSLAVQEQDALKVLRPGDPTPSWVRWG